MLYFCLIIPDHISFYLITLHHDSQFLDHVSSHQISSHLITSHDISSCLIIRHHISLFLMPTASVWLYLAMALPLADMHRFHSTFFHLSSIPFVSPRPQVRHRLRKKKIKHLPPLQAVFALWHHMFGHGNCFSCRSWCSPSKSYMTMCFSLASSFLWNPCIMLHNLPQQLYSSFAWGLFAYYSACHRKPISDHLRFCGVFALSIFLWRCCACVGGHGSAREGHRRGQGAECSLSLTMIQWYHHDIVMICHRMMCYDVRCMIFDIFVLSDLVLDSRFTGAWRIMPGAWYSLISMELRRPEKQIIQLTSHFNGALCHLCHVSCTNCRWTRRRCVAGTNATAKDRFVYFAAIWTFCDFECRHFEHEREQQNIAASDWMIESGQVCQVASSATLGRTERISASHLITYTNNHKRQEKSWITTHRDGFQRLWWIVTDGDWLWYIHTSVHLFFATTHQSCQVPPNFTQVFHGFLGISLLLTADPRRADGATKGRAWTRAGGCNDIYLGVDGSLPLFVD